MGKKEEKTNVMRILEQNHIPYEAHEYPHGKEAVDGVTVASVLHLDPKTVFKTLVTRGMSKNYYVFVIPVENELDLKKCARAVGEKSVEMIPVKELLPLTGYVRGGCSPVGMKKPFVTTFHESVDEISTIYVSAGKIGFQIQTDPKDLVSLVKGKKADLIRE